MKDEDFYEKVKDVVIFKNLAGEYKPVQEYFGEEVTDEDAQKGVQPKAVNYVSDQAQQAHYVELFKNAGQDAVICDEFIDPHFISFIEYKNYRKCRFMRIDADIAGALMGDAAAEESQKAVQEIFEKHLSQKGVAIKAQSLKNQDTLAVITVEEFARRMSEMGGFYGVDEADGLKNATLVVNVNSPVIAALPAVSAEKQEAVVFQAYYLALLSHKKLTKEEMSDFMQKSCVLLQEYTK